MLNTTLGKAPRPVASPARKRRDTKRTPQKKKEKLDELRKKLLMGSDDEDSEDEDMDPGRGTGGGPAMTREAMIEEATASLLLDRIAVVEKKLEELGRTGDPAKKDYCEATPLKDLPTEWIHVGPVSGTPTELNMANFDDVNVFVMDNFTKANFEDAAMNQIPGILCCTSQLKRSAEVVCKAVETYGVKCKGPKRLKMTCILFSLMIAKANEG